MAKPKDDPVLSTIKLRNLNLCLRLYYGIKYWDSLIKMAKHYKTLKKLPVIVQNCMYIYQISYKKPETILVILHSTPNKICQRQIAKIQKKV